MRIHFEFLREPLQLSDTEITTLCIENQTVFRETVALFLTEEPEAKNVIFSESFVPFRYRGNVCFIDNVFALSCSGALLKKMYERMERYCASELAEETQAMKLCIHSFLDLLVQKFDYDLECSPEIDLPNLFKMQNMRPRLEEGALMENLLNYMLFLSQYAGVKCFVLLNVHLFFSPEELSLFYKDVVGHHLKLLVLENVKFFEKSALEKTIVCDKDLCEIVETVEDSWYNVHDL